MSFALVGVMAMQWYFFRQSYILQSRLFDQSVHQALKNVVDHLAKSDANSFLERKVEMIEPSSKSAPKPQFASKPKPFQKSKRARLSDANYLLSEQRKADSIFRLRDSIIRAKYPIVFSFDDVISQADLKDLQYNFQVDVFQFEDAFGQIHEQTRKTISRAFGANNLNTNNALSDSVTQYIVVDPVEGTFLRTIPRPKIKNFVRQESDAENTAQKVEQFFAGENDKKEEVFKDLYQEYKEVNVPLKERVQVQVLDSLLHSELRNLSILSDFEFKLSSAKRDSIIFISASAQSEFLPSNSYETQLFPKDMIRDPGMLTITFPDKDNIILSNLAAMMGLSGLLLLVLVFIFAYTIHSILRQKKISEMKTDFINNMTHEFKTPVATIMIASEALKDPELNSDKNSIDRLAGIIYDENIRLGNHIERVLNIAKIEKGDLKLERKEVEMNDLLAAIVDSMCLQFEKRDAKVELELNASFATVIGDEFHLSNVIFNLLDNANKYSRESPQIKVSTQNVGKKLIIKVSDKGIGMTKDQLSKIFDQFYRIPTGNLHDVKGFGLGLSYVHDIVKGHNGSIKVKSEKDIGSEFEICFPINF